RCGSLRRAFPRRSSARSACGEAARISLALNPGDTLNPSSELPQQAARRLDDDRTMAAVYSRSSGGRHPHATDAPRIVGAHVVVVAEPERDQDRSRTDRPADSDTIVVAAEAGAERKRRPAHAQIHARPIVLAVRTDILGERGFGQAVATMAIP